MYSKVHNGWGGRGPQLGMIHAAKGPTQCRVVYPTPCSNIGNKVTNLSRQALQGRRTAEGRKNTSRASKTYIHLEIPGYLSFMSVIDAQSIRHL
jgi:hypothetical protein